MSKNKGQRLTESNKSQNKLKQGLKTCNLPSCCTSCCLDCLTDLLFDSLEANLPRRTYSVSSWSWRGFCAPCVTRDRELDIIEYTVCNYVSILQSTQCVTILQSTQCNGPGYYCIVTRKQDYIQLRYRVLLCVTCTMQI